MTPSSSGIPSISIHALREEGDTSTLWSSSCSRYFYPRPPRGGRRRRCSKRQSGVSMSIHALREEGDSALEALVGVGADFYPRPPRGGRPIAPALFCARTDFYPRPPRGGRPPTTAHTSPGRYFYPRPPRGGRHYESTWRDGIFEFLSTPSARRATEHPQGCQNRKAISIHALREEGDAIFDGIKIEAIRISIHALREEGDMVG